MNTLDRVKAVIGDHAGLVSTMIGDDQALGTGNPLPADHPNRELGWHHDGLGFDWLDRIELALRLGEHFGIDIPDADVDRPELGTAQGIADYIDGRLKALAGSPDAADALTYMAHGLQPGAACDEILLDEGDGVQIVAAGAVANLPGHEPLQPSEAVAESTVDYASMPAGDMLAAIGTDAAKWTEAFFQVLKVRGEADDGSMLGWFANAIEVGRGAGYEQGKLAGLGMEEPDPGASDTAWGSRHHPARPCDYVPSEGDPVEAADITVLDLLMRCASQFRFYEKQHRLKALPTDEHPFGQKGSLAKAEVNARMAERIETFLRGEAPVLPGEINGPHALIVYEDGDYTILGAADIGDEPNRLAVVSVDAVLRQCDAVYRSTALVERLLEVAMDFPTVRSFRFVDSDMREAINRTLRESLPPRSQAPVLEFGMATAPPHLDPEVEEMAERIYDAMPYDGTAGPEKPKWVPGGNSDKQEEARRLARESIKASEAARSGKSEYHGQPIDPPLDPC